MPSSRHTPADSVSALDAGLIGPLPALALLVGACAAIGLPALPSSSWLTLMLTLAAGMLLLRPLRLPGIALLGFAWLCLHAGWGMQARLPPALEGADLVIEGRIDGLVRREERRQRFDFLVDIGQGDAAVLAGQRIRLSWYEHGEAIAAGSRWRFVVRLQRPHGGRNPGGFDFERYALQRGLAATGYVRRALDEASPTSPGIDRVRERLASRLDDVVDSSVSRFLRGIAIADTRALDDADWETLRDTGTSHLLAISGLHLGLLAGLVALLVRLGYGWFPRIGLRIPLPQGAALAAIVAASAYALLAGLGLPTRRALLMLGCVLLARLSRRSTGRMQGLSLALVVMLLIDPLAILGAGFWLSFAGVAWLLWTLPAGRGANAGRGWRWVREAFMAQLVLGLGLLPLSVAFFGQSSLLALPLNLLAIPLLAFVILPSTLLGSTLLLLGLPADWPLWLAATAMEGLWWLLAQAAAMPFASLELSSPGFAALILAGLGVVWLLLPRGVPGKPLALMLLLPLFLPLAERTPPASLDVRVLDVGQGLSVLLRTADHALLYDAGPAPPGALDYGEAVVVPALRQSGLQRLDRLIVTHGDNDHAGGAMAVLRAMKPGDFLSGEPSRLPGSTHCEAGQRWRWDGVDFQLLHPPPHFPALRNQSSCVLLVEAGGQRMLLPGDIDALIESRLLREYPDLAAIDVLLVPHHGSGGSSSAAFVNALRPRLALISAGHRNRFGHPRAEVLARYRDMDSQLHGTAGEGALSLRLGVDPAAPVALGERQAHPRLWSEAVERPR